MLFYDLRGHEPEPAKDQSRNDDDIVKVTQHGNEVRDQVDGRQRVSYRQAKKHSRQARSATVGNDTPTHSKLLDQCPPDLGQASTDAHVAYHVAIRMRPRGTQHAVV